MEKRKQQKAKQSTMTSTTNDFKISWKFIVVVIIGVCFILFLTVHYNDAYVKSQNKTNAQNSTKDTTVNGAEDKNIVQDSVPNKTENANSEIDSSVINPPNTPNQQQTQKTSNNNSPLNIKQKGNSNEQNAKIRDKGDKPISIEQDGTGNKQNITIE